jgi:uncharacterized protein (DUF608 family)
MKDLRYFVVFFAVHGVLGAADGPAAAGGSRAEPAEAYLPCVPVDKKLDPQWVKSLTEKGGRKVYAGDELKYLAMPCGGIGAGELSIRGDGNLASWCIFNEVQYGNANGAHYLQPRVEDRRLEHGFAISVRPSGQAASVLRLTSADFDDIRFIGEYPIATLEYRRKNQDLPVSVRSEVFSPFVPLSVRDSANPVTVLAYTVTNTSAQPVEVALAGWLENFAPPGERGICNPGGSFGGFSCPCVNQPRVSAGVRRNRLIQENGLTSVLLEVQDPPPAKEGQPVRKAILFDNFERDAWGSNWKAEGDAFGGVPLRVADVPFNLPIQNHEGAALATSHLAEGQADKEGKLVSKPFRIERRHILFRIGGGAHADRTCLNLRLGGKVVRSSAGGNSNALIERSWDVSELEGQEAVLEIVDQQQGSWGFVLVDDIRFGDEASPVVPVNRAGPHFGDMSLSLLGDQATGSAAWTSTEDFLAAWRDGNVPQAASRDYPLDSRPCGSVASAPLTLAPGQTHTFTFLVSWHFPNLYNSSPGCPGRVGHIYNNWYKNSREAAAWVAADFERLAGATRQFRDSYFATTLPYWLVQRIGMPVSTLAADNVSIWENGRMYGFEGVAFCFGTCGHVYNFAVAAARLFPELERSVRLLQDLGPGFDPASGRVNFRGHDGPNPTVGHAYGSDAQSGYVLKIYREHLLSADQRFLDGVWPQVKRIIGYHIFRDGAERGLEPNGVLEGLQTFWDPMWYGPNPYNNTLYLAALRAAEAMARIKGETQLADRYHAIFASGRKYMDEQMWNGEYFVHLYPEGFTVVGSDNGIVSPADDQGNAKRYIDAFNSGLPNYYRGGACDANQLFGQNWANQLGLGYILPPDKCRTAARNIFRYNWTPDISTVYSRYPAHSRTLAAPGEGALVNGAWPKVERQSFENTHDKENVWTGLEYEAACDMLNEGLLEEGLTVIRAIHDRYNGAKRNPWNEIEGWDHYSRAMHAWNCLLALSGQIYDGPAGIIGFAPRFKPEDFQCFYSGAQGWGTYHQKIAAATQSADIAVQWGSLRVLTVVLEVPAGANVASAEISLAGKALDCKIRQKDRRVTLDLAQPATIACDQVLSARLRW